MKVSLLIPCYNAAAFLPRLIASASAQTRPFDEIICYDDASTDTTLTVATALGLTIIAGKVNKGPSYARNRLIEAATGDWLHFQDADDVLHPQFVEKMTAQLTAAHTQLICNCGTQNAEGTIGQNLTNYSVQPETDATAYFLQHIGLAIVGLYNRSFLLEQGIRFREYLRFNEDPDFHVQLAMAGARFQSVPETLVYVVGHAQSSSTLHWWSCISNQIFCLQQYYRALPATYWAVISTQLADKAYYAIRSGHWRVGYRAVYVLQRDIGNRFRFSRFYLNVAKTLIGPSLFFKLCMRLSSQK
jgi:glycosyltransferase involved in cell wall biosynthesis